MFAKDRDLYVLEPGLHKDVAWFGQRLINAVGSLSGTTLTMTTGSLVDAGISAGHVVLFDGVPMEVVSVESATQATVSLMRGDVSGVAIGGVSGTNRSVVVYGYGPQLGVVHRQVLAMIGVDSDVDGLDESAVTNPGALVRLEALGALHLIYAAAGAPGKAGEKFEHRAAMYKERFANERQRVVAMIDTDDDGIADHARRPNVMMLDRV